MEFGAFSVSLAVKDIQKSRDFYEAIGFTVVLGDQAQNWLIMRNGETTIGLFQDMFEANILTFNPGWDSSAGNLDSFTDVRILKKDFAAKGLDILSEAGEENEGPASFSLVDPDGNSILFDQHR